MVTPSAGARSSKPAGRPGSVQRGIPHHWLLAGILLLSVGIKVALLLTSQSMADGDEAVEGLMAMHILGGQGHPIYPYGIRYGAGAGLEAHLAALIFKVAGPSSIALKSVGLLLWCASLLLVYLIGKRAGGSKTALAAAALFGLSPAAAQWSLKVAGGHQVAVVLCLLMVWLQECGVHPALIMPLVPLAAFAHPVALPFAAFFAIRLFWRGGHRRAAFLSLLGASALSVLLLYPRLPAEQAFWNPSAKGFHPLPLMHGLLVSLLTFFTPNLNAPGPPHGFVLVVSVFWMLALFLSAAALRRSRFFYYALSVFGVAFLVDSAVFTSRHLIVLQPIACLLLATALVRLRKYGVAAVAGLVLLGAAVQLNETRSPFIYGAGREGDGVKRIQVQTILRQLRDNQVRYVYNGEPMLHWILMFESREQIIARGTEVHDRVPEYARRVDRARRQGLAAALLVRMTPAQINVYLHPDSTYINDNFPAIP